MCFSAEASLGVGAALVPAGAYCVRAALRTDRAYLPLAATPLLFAAQQFCEAGVWAGLDHDRPGLARWASLGFLFFALGFWPAWIPLCALRLARPGPRREALAALAAAGLTFGSLCFLPAALGPDRWPAPAVVGHSVRYDFSALPVAERVGGPGWVGLYLALVCGPLVLTADRRVRWLGALVAASAAVTVVLFREAFASVWCYCAAVLSAYLCFVVRGRAPPAPPARHTPPSDRPSSTPAE